LFQHWRGRGHVGLTLLGQLVAVASDLKPGALAPAAAEEKKCEYDQEQYGYYGADGDAYYGACAEV